MFCLFCLRNPGVFCAVLGLGVRVFAVEVQVPSPLSHSKLLEGERGMVQRLTKLAADAASAPQDNVYLSHERIEWFKSEIQLTRSVQQLLYGQSGYAMSLLNNGANEQAIQALDQYQRSLKKYAPSHFDRMLPNIGLLMGVSFLRIGEAENCLENHTIDSCLFPIQDAGIHRLPGGSKAASNIFQQLLRKNPDDFSARWLLNLAQMTLGDYPANLNAAWEIPRSRFSSEASMPRFPDIAGRLGLDVDALCGGSVVDDFDGDSDLDLVMTSFGLQDQIRFYRNEGDGRFSDETESAGLWGQVGGLNLIHADYNNDGYLDLFVLRGGWFGPGGNHPNSLLMNQKNGRFLDVTEEAGVLSYHPTQAATWFDYDNDGWLDLFIGNESGDGRSHPCELFRNNQDGTFKNVASEVGGDFERFVKGVVSADYDNDGWADLLVSCLG